MTDYRIPFNRPAVTGREGDYIQQAIAAARLSGDGPFSRRAEELLRGIVGAPRVLLTASCTAALEMAALLLDLQPGDEVIVPAFTFVSTANAFVTHGARPVFADCRPDTLNIDERIVPALLSSRTRAVVVMHYAGVACELEVLSQLAASRGLMLIEDNAHGLFGTYAGRSLGTFGTFATQSFHETKNVTCGEGGALIVNDPAFVRRAEIVREKGTNRSRFFRGEVDKYTWVDRGANYLASELQAAYLVAQLEARATIQCKRMRAWNRYEAELGAWADRNGVQRPTVPAKAEHPAHLYYLLMPTEDAQQRLIAHLAAHRILAVFHYLPLNTSEMGQRLGGRPGQCPVTERASGRLVRLPLYADLTADDQSAVIEAVLAFRA
jgi:dTDP-4-amino-4,6-dideoxygalactose transaminase